MKIEIGPRYLTRNGEEIFFMHKHLRNCIWCPVNKRWYDSSKGYPPGKGDLAVIQQLSSLTLPPAVGNRYRYRNKRKPEEQRECVITETFDGIFRSQSIDRKRANDWTYWPDGQAKVNNQKDYVAWLTEDIPLTSIEALRQQREERMKHLEELKNAHS